MTSGGGGPAGAPLQSYKVGTLAYTRAGLVTLFAWLLWGDFVLSLMETVMPSLLPLTLRANGATFVQMSVLGIISQVINIGMNPFISYSSDRHRGRMGRRRPYILYTTPFVVLFLAAIPFGPEILAFISKPAWIAALLARSHVLPIILVLGALSIGYTIFNMYIATVYYYLVPDVVPEACLGRFFGLFRVFGLAAGLIFNYWLFGLSEHHEREIYVGISLLYGVCIMLMCWGVKEGEYPPVEEDKSTGHWWDGIFNYGKECFSHAHYWWAFIAYSSLPIACGGTGMLVFLYTKDLGFSRDAWGKLLAYTNIAALVLAYPLGILLDKWGSQKMLITGMALWALTSFIPFFAISGSTSASFWRIANFVAYYAVALAEYKWIVDVYPRDRFGQFCSAGAVVCSAIGILLSPVLGMLLDHYQNRFHNCLKVIMRQAT